VAIIMKRMARETIRMVLILRFLNIKKLISTKI